MAFFFFEQFLQKSNIQEYDDRCSAFTCNSDDALRLHCLACLIHKDVSKMADRDSSSNQSDKGKVQIIGFLLKKKKKKRGKSVKSPILSQLTCLL